MTLPQLAPEPGPAEPPGPGVPARPPAHLHVTVHAIPDPDPPYDDEAAGAPYAAADPSRPAPDRPPGGASRAPLPPCPPMPAGASLRLVPPDEFYDDDEEEDESFEPVRTPRAELEDPVPRAAMLARALLEAMAGIRPVSQLAKWVTADVLAVIQASVVHRAARPAPTALRRVLVSEPMPGIAEVTAVVDRGNRTEALAMRLEGLDGRWVVTALQRP